ncbi:hypothetical protein BX600DRAFT_473921 [Xylariales sp. PMI_506]|nr:hypothetical protein BX600DRAFT_473921 [Xylariales sp. PMI_506]
MTGIPKLPHEVISSIASYLDTIDFCHLRLTSRQLREGSLFLFSKRYFTKRLVTLQRDSLETLAQIAKHDSFGPAVVKLGINISHLLRDQKLQIQILDIWNLLPDAGDEIGPINPSVYDELFADQQLVISSNLGATLLAQSIAKLPNLRCIFLDETSRPWGRRALERKMGMIMMDVMDTPESNDFVKRGINIIIEAIATSSEIALREFEIHVGSESIAVTAEMLALPPLSPALIRDKFSSITDLGLTLNPDSIGDDRHWNASFLKFMDLFPALCRFDLRFLPRDKHTRFPVIVAALHLPKLENLSLSKIDCTEEELKSFLYRHAETLRKIYLFTIDIVEGGSWQSLIRGIQQVLQLESLYLDYCRLANKYIAYMDVDDGEVNDSISYGYEFEFQGSQAEWIDILEHIVVKA